MKYCQGPECHTYETKDRIRGPKGAKTYQTRRRSQFYYLGHNACSMQCERDWFNKFGDQAVNHFGRITEPKKLVPENAWVKRHGSYDNTNDRWNYVIENRLLGESRPITQEQYEDERFTLNQG
tara:strand:- start:244 stop:612 length:369 start_codon:yes stop_codon:yes gene_type:complete